MPDSDMPAAVAGPGFPRVALGLAWVASALAVGAVGYLLLAISDRRENAAAGWVLLGLAGLGVVAAGAVASNRRRAMTLGFSIAASAAFVVGGVVAVLLLAGSGNSFAADLLLVGGTAVLAGVVSGLLGLRPRRMAR